MTERERNDKRYDRLSQEKKNALNETALKQFLKPIEERNRPVDLLDKIDFN